MRPGASLAALLAALLAAAAPAAAQDAPAPAEASAEPLPGSGTVHPLRRGQTAPFEGFLIEADDLVLWRLTIERLQFQIDAERERARLVLEVHEDLAARRLAAAGERLELVQRLWGERANEWGAALTEANRRAQRGVEESPVLWLAIGLAVGVVGAVALGLALAP